MKTQYQHDLARRLILAAITADAGTPLVGKLDKRSGWIRWSANPQSTPDLYRAPAARMSDEGRAKFLRLLAKTIGVDAFVRIADDLARQNGREMLTTFLDRAAPGWRDRRAA